MVVALYLIIGSIYNVTKGKSGCPEVLPQYDFWKAFFMSAIVSVILLLACIHTKHHCYYRRESTSLLILSLVVCVQERLGLHLLQNTKNFSDLLFISIGVCVNLYFVFCRYSDF